MLRFNKTAHKDISDMFMKLNQTETWERIRNELRRRKANPEDKAIIFSRSSDGEIHYAVIDNQKDLDNYRKNGVPDGHKDEGVFGQRDYFMHVMGR